MEKAQKRNGKYGEKINKSIYIQGVTNKNILYSRKLRYCAIFFVCRCPEELFHDKIVLYHVIILKNGRHRNYNEKEESI